jgi:hypothetical protein
MGSKESNELRVTGGADKNAFLQDPLLLLNKAVVNRVVSDPKPNLNNYRLEVGRFAFGGAQSIRN